MKRTTLIRQAIAAEQIKKALEDRGLSNKQFVNEDILTSGTLPKVILPLQESEIVKKYAGIIKPRCTACTTPTAVSTSIPEASKNGTT